MSTLSDGALVVGAKRSGTSHLRASLCRVGTVPSAVAPGQTLAAGVSLASDPALPRSVLCLLGITYAFASR